MAVELDEMAGPFGGEESRRLAGFWKKQLDKIRDDTRHKRWIKRAEAIEKRYRDDRANVNETGVRRYNALWANVEILTPAIYGRCPVPIAERRFKDKDPVGRGAAQILERGLRNEIEICGFDEAVQHAVRDYLIAGRGSVWVRYEPQLEEGISIVNEGSMDIDDAQGEIEPEDDSPDAEKLRETGDRVARESTPVDYIHWSDFFIFPHNARTWKEVTAVAKRVYMTREQMKDRFGRTVGKEVPLKKDDRSTLQYDGPDTDPDDKGEVYEIWSLVDKTVLWIADGYDYLCDRKDDPLQLENFFPCPRPIFANATTNTLVPVPDYIEYQDQAIQIDELTMRISMLTKACKVTGVYNAQAKDVQRMFQESTENELIPVDDWSAFAEKGGVAGQISLLPLQEIMGVLDELYKIKDKCILEMDRLTGISDIMRGTTDARETLGAQRLKTNSSGTRLQRRQNEVARFSRDTLRISADIMCQHFSPQSLIEVSGALYEEGLGDVEMPSLTALQSPPGPPQTPPAPFASQVPQPNAPPAVPGAAPLYPPVGAAPLPSPGTNIVPFPGPQQPPGPPPMPPEMVAKMQGLQRIAAAIQLLRDERMRGFRVDLEVDSTVYGDSEQDKADRIEFIKATTGFLQESIQLSTMVPEITPLLGKFLQFGVRGFKVGRDLESAVEEFCDEAAGTAKKRQQEMANKPNPQLITAQAAMLKAQAAIKGVDAKAQVDTGRLQMDAQKNQQQMAGDAAQAQAEVQRQQLENQGEQDNARIELQKQMIDLQMKNKDLEIANLKMQAEVLKVQAQASLNQQKMDLSREEMDQKGDLAKQEFKHKEKLNEQELDHTKDAHKQELAHNTSEHKQDLKHTKALDEIKAKKAAEAPKKQTS